MDQSEADNATPSANKMPVAVVVSSTTPPKTSLRRRINPQAKYILEDYFQQVSQSPSSTEKEALLEKIKKAVPECQDYNLARLTSWFGARRQRLRIKERKKEQSLLPKNDSRFPSLTPAAIQHLTVLASNQLHPSSELLKTWTTLLAGSGAIEQDVVNWIHHRNQEQPLQHTPTSSNTTTMTPEPLSAISHLQSQIPFLPYKQETAASPATGMLALRPDEHASEAMPVHEAQATPSEPSPTSSSPKSDNELNQCIIHGVRDALASRQTMQNAAPKTAAEFDALFSPFEQQILLLLHTLEST